MPLPNAGEQQNNTDVKEESHQPSSHGIVAIQLKPHPATGITVLYEEPKVKMESTGQQVPTHFRRWT